MERSTRREFLRAAAGIAGAGLALRGAPAGAAAPVEYLGTEPGERPKQAEGVAVLNPRGRVPVSLIIDDSTCLVNLAHFGIPQFAETWPKNYLQPWKTLPREIPDAFVRKFGEWCREHGVKGKYSLVPYPACVGWLDRYLPGWSKKELEDSLDLARTLLAPDWDFHPEMVSHTRVIDLATGRPYPDPSPKFMENWEWTRGKSADEIGAYIAYALRILKNAGIECEGMTTPGGFGNNARAALAQGTLQACRSVYGTEIPHYFRHLFTGRESVAPRVEYAADLEGSDPRCVVSIIGCTGDWFGGWDGLVPGSVDKCITEDLKGGRLPEVIARGEPAFIVCHWPGIYFNGDEVGFKIFQEVVRRLHAGFDNLVWMKQSEVSRYWAARELTAIERAGTRVAFRAPFACPAFTVRVPCRPGAVPSAAARGRPIALKEVAKPLALESGTWVRDGDGAIVCFDLPKGASAIEG
ncbi:MAG: hypothetical protein JXP34_01190 [Planctomycetes bacterium]|nr:hypothetical protein [Planctomycetota bacterium]